MPQSRGRFPRNKSQAIRRREQQRCTRVARPQLQFGPDDWVVVRRGIEAEARGDAEAALELHLAGPHVGRSFREARLRELVALGAEVRPWMLSRWIVGQARRWLLLDDADEIRRGVCTAVDTAFRGIDFSRPMGRDPREFTLEVAGQDWVASEVALYEYGGLRRFLHTVADRDLVARADRVEEWIDVPMGGYRFEDLIDDRLVVSDFATGRLLEVLNLGSNWTLESDASVIGRLVPVSVGPGLMFESRPIGVDSVTAHDVAASSIAGSDGWTVALTLARQQDRLPLGFSTLVPTSYLTDLPGGGVTGLKVEGITAPGPDASVTLADFVLDQVEFQPFVASHLAMQLAHLLVDVDLRTAVAERCTQSSRRAAWLAISRVLPDPISAYALNMAEAASA